MHPLRTASSLAATASIAVLASACSTSSGSTVTTLHLGYFPNVTHAAAVYGVASGAFARDLGPTRLEAETFNAGPSEVEALFAGSIDAAYIGPGPAVNAFIRSHGAVVIVAGATSGGASLVVRPGVTSLRGRTIADPQTGGTQDIALRTYLAAQGLKVDRQGGGDATILAEDNAQTLGLFKAGGIDGAWVPEPWASRLVLEGHGTVLVDERSLWPSGQFVSTNLLVRRDFLDAHPDVVRSLVSAEVDVNRAISANPAAAALVINDALKKLTGKALTSAVITRALSQIALTVDPLAASLKEIADHSFATGLVKKGPLKGIYELAPLQAVTGKTYDDAGLGA